MAIIFFAVTIYPAAVLIVATLFIRLPNKYLLLAWFNIVEIIDSINVTRLITGVNSNA